MSIFFCNFAVAKEFAQDIDISQNERKKKMRKEDQIQSLVNLHVTADVVHDVRSILEEARRLSVRTVNSTMVFSYWLIGRRIVQEEQQGAERATYGEQILKRLSHELTSEFGEGFSYANLKNMRKFYKTYPDEKGYTLCSQLPWSHNRLIMRVDDPSAREWYLREAAEQQWTVRQLERNIHSFYYQRQLGSGKTKMLHACSQSTPTIDTRSFVKDPYVLEFVGLPPYPEHHEKPLEDARQIFASKYLPYLPSEEEIRRELEQRPMIEE